MNLSISDSAATKYPVSIKGVLLNNRKVLLLKNERDEWELPGGKLDPGEAPKSCLTRELKEETGLDVFVEQLLDVYIYRVGGIVDVLIVAYKCNAAKWGPLHISDEHREMRWFDVSTLDNINLPIGYTETIKLVANI